MLDEEVLDPLLDDGDDPQPAMPTAAAQRAATAAAGRTKRAFIGLVLLNVELQIPRCDGRDATDYRLLLLEWTVPT